MAHENKVGKVVVSTFSCRRGSFRICGNIYRADKQTGGLTPVIICHGFMGNQREGRVDTIDVISEYPSPVFLACGKKDPVVAYDYMERLLATFRQKRDTGNTPDASVQFFPVQDAGHGFNKREHQMVAQRVVAFMKG